jgi:hypothetical protein
MMATAAHNGPTLKELKQREKDRRPSEIEKKELRKTADMLPAMMEERHVIQPMYGHMLINKFGIKQDPDGKPIERWRQYKLKVPVKRPVDHYKKMHDLWVEKGFGSVRDYVENIKKLVHDAAAKSEDEKGREGTLHEFMYQCPACGHMHGVHSATWPVPKFLQEPKSAILQQLKKEFLENNWKFDGNYEKPTITPSIHIKNLKDPTKICHGTITDGNIYFHTDSSHHLAGKKVELPEIVICN